MADDCYTHGDNFAAKIILQFVINIEEHIDIT